MNEMNMENVNDLTEGETATPGFVEYQGLPRWLLSVLAFPLGIGAVLAWAISAINAGQDPKQVLVIGTVVGGLFVIFLEHIHPHTRKWLLSHGDVRADILHLFLTTILSTAALEALLKIVLGFAAIALSQLVGDGLWPSSWPLVWQLILALIIGDFGYYWWHRLAHETPFLWRFHATHHSVERLYWLNAARVHPIDNWIAFTVQTGPLLLLGAGPELIALYALFVAVHGLFQHCNIRVKLGPLNWLFSMAELHRWHHSKQVREEGKALGNCNYGANLIIWDVVFGTRYLPRDKIQPIEDFGIYGMNSFPKSYWRQMMSPFIWKKLKVQNNQSS